jgi:hypothetical protein
MKYRLLTLFSIIVALAVKTYTINAQEGAIDDEDVELLASWELKNKSDSVHHQKQVNRIVKELAKAERITEQYTGAASLTKCETYQEYTRLKKAANEFELNKLLIHRSPIIRVYAHRALMENNMTPNTFHIESIANDSTEIEWLNGDVLVKTTVMDLVTNNMFQFQEEVEEVTYTPELVNID